jgi:fructose-bisphosphate aldolase, class I
MTTTRRISRIFRPDGRALIVAMDHGMLFGYCQGLEHPGSLIASVVAGGADAVIAPLGMAEHFSKELARVGLLLRIDRATPAAEDLATCGSEVAGAEQALRLGADGVVAFAFPNAPEGEATIERLAVLVRSAHAWGLPVCAEMVPGSLVNMAQHSTLENLVKAARIAADVGADFLKMPYCPGYEQVLDSCYVPVVILGGTKRGSAGDMLQEVSAALAAGASGVAIGRNVFQAENPAAMTAALAALIHGHASADEALGVLLDGERAYAAQGN